MIKKNIGVIVTSSVLVAGALAGGIVAVTKAEDRSNAYAPSLLQKQRLSLLDTFINDDHYFENHDKAVGKDIGNPFALFSQAKISEIAGKALVKQPDFLDDLGYSRNTTADKLNFDLIGEMSFLRLDKNQDTILIAFNMNTPQGVKPKAFTKRLLKLNLNVEYETNKLKEWADELKPEAVLNRSASKLSDTFSPLKMSDLRDIKAGFESAGKHNATAYLGAFKSLVADQHTATDPDGFSKAILQSLILWKVYGFDQNSIIPKTFGELKTHIETEKAKDPDVVDNINEIIGPFASGVGFFPTALSVVPTAQIINSDMDLIKSFDVTKLVPESTGLFDEFEASSLLGLELFPDAEMQILSGVMTFVPASKTHRPYNVLGAPRTGGEHDYQGMSLFEDALDNYEYFIKEVD